MTSPASDSLQEIQIRLDQRIQSVDEPRWLSSRYAPASERQTLIILYAFYYELARVRIAVSDQTLGKIRFQWWRDALSELARDEIRQHDVVLALADQVQRTGLDLSDLGRLIDGYEAAFLDNDRGLEPDAEFMTIVAQILAPQAAPPEALAKIAKEWAGLRRGERDLVAVPTIRVVGKLRPGVAHFRLRRSWAAQKTLSALQQRLSILMAMVTGRV